MQYWYDIVKLMLITRVELITISIVTIRSICHNSAADFFAFWKFPPQICESKYETFSFFVKYIQSSNRRRKERPNRSIIGDDILLQSATKVTKTCGSEFVDLLWCHLTLQRKMAIWVHNYTVPQVHIGPKDILENLLPQWLLGRTNLFVPSRFWTTCTNFDNVSAI